MSKLSIIMYHYVREIEKSRYPRIKGLEFEGFKKQLDYLTSKFTVISQDEIIYSINCNKKLPENACWLTFDDGYKDHFEYVFPELKQRGLKGSFFPSRDAVLNKKLLDVNAIHLILANCTNFKLLADKIDSYCIAEGMTSTKLSQMKNLLCVPNQFDEGLVIYIKRVLQHALPKAMRQQLIELLFLEYVGMSRVEFSEDFYMSVDDLKEMNLAGMEIGNHGSSHTWMDKIPANEQEKDIVKSLDFLEEVSGSLIDNWTMCYPFGAFNKDTLEIVGRYGGKIGITTQSAQADLLRDNILALPRLDTNAFPQ